MNILYLSLTPNMRLGDPSGYGTHMREVARALEEGGHRLVVSVAGGGAPTAAPGGVDRPSARSGGGLLGPGLRGLLPGRVRGLARDLYELGVDRRARARLRALVEHRRIEAIYERAAMLQVAGLEVAAALRLPHVLEFNSPVEERREHHGFPLWRLGVRCERRQLELADRIICVSSPLRRYLIDRGADPGRVHVVPNAARPEAFRISADERRAVRAELGVGEDDVALGFVGRFGFWRGMVPLVRAMAEVVRAEPRARGVLIGDGQLMPEVRQVIAELEVGDRIKLTGSIDHRLAPSRAAALDIGILADGKWYGSPTKLFEYGAAGLCVVAPRVEAIEEVLRDGAEGVLVPPSDAAALAAALRALVRDAGRRRELARRFKERVEAEFTWKRVAERVTAYLESSERRPAGGRHPAGRRSQAI